MYLINYSIDKESIIRDLQRWCWIIGVLVILTNITMSLSIVGSDPIGKTKLLVFLISFSSIYLFLLFKVAQYRNWARNAFIFITVVVVLPLAPLILFVPSLVQIFYFGCPSITCLLRLLSIITTLGGLALAAYLFLPQTRSLFTLWNPDFIMRVIMVMAALFVSSIGLFLWVGEEGAFGRFLVIKQGTVLLTPRGEHLAKARSEKLRNEANAMTGIQWPSWGYWIKSMQSKDSTVVLSCDLNPFEYLIAVVAPHGEKTDLNQVFQTIVRNHSDRNNHRHFFSRVSKEPRPLDSPAIIQTINQKQLLLKGVPVAVRQIRLSGSGSPRYFYATQAVFDKGDHSFTVLSGGLSGTMQEGRFMDFLVQLSQKN